jgi:hypothetical protein
MNRLLGVVVLALGFSCASPGGGKPAQQTKGDLPAPAPGALDGSGSATEPWKVGDVVFGQWTDGNWYLGKIAAINPDGTYAVNYNDGDVSPSLSDGQVRRPPTITIPKVEPATPDTPAGRTLRAWLDVFNSGDEPRTRTFAEQHKGPHDPGVYHATGGFHLLSIEKSAPLEVTFVVKEKANPSTSIGWLRLKSAKPVEIESILILAIPPGKTAADMDPKVDVATRTRVLDAIVTKLNDLYVFPDVAKKMERALRDHQQKGAYEAAPESRAFATLLTGHLRAVSRDKHLRVEFMAMAIPADEPSEPSAADKERMRAQLERINCGFQKVERIAGNIGYVKFNMFADAELCGAKVTEMLGSLGDVDALIFDLRENGGGHPEMVAFVASYLFSKRTRLNDIYDRKENKTTQYWTKPDVPGNKLSRQPVFVLTSHQTFSAAEDFAYALKNLKRATIIGETTGGGAHPTMVTRLDDHFMLAVPHARSISPITKTDWEGTGVEPDIKTSAAQALDTAKKLAAERIEHQKKKQRTRNK